MPETVPKISVQDAKKMMDRGEGVLFVDSRNPQAWGSSTSKLPGAVRVPADDVQSHVNELPRDRTIITYCT
jgi:rhodanese-related sulfurtransferase